MWGRHLCRLARSVSGCGAFDQPGAGRLLLYGRAVTRSRTWAGTCSAARHARALARVPLAGLSLWGWSDGLGENPPTYRITCFCARRRVQPPVSIVEQRSRSSRLRLGKTDLRRGASTACSLRIPGCRDRSRPRRCWAMIAGSPAEGLCGVLRRDRADVPPRILDTVQGHARGLRRAGWFATYPPRRCGSGIYRVCVSQAPCIPS